MEMKVGLTFACMNLKKLAKIKVKWGLLEEKTTQNFYFERNSFDKRKIALKYKYQSRFVYSLKLPYKGQLPIVIFLYLFILLVPLRIKRLVKV